MRWLSKAFGVGHPSIKAPPARIYPTIPDTWPIQRQLNAWNDRVSELLATFGAAPEAIEAAHQRSLDLMDLLVDRNLDGKEAERAGRMDEAIALYEANVADQFDGSHPYERLLIHYSHSNRPAEARRVAEACLAHAHAGMTGRLRARCEKALANIQASDPPP